MWTIIERAMRSRRLAFCTAYLLGHSLLLTACPPTPSETSSDASSGAQTDTSSTTSMCTIGSVNCPCTQGGACDPGLVCSVDKVCVDDGGNSGSGSTSGSTSDMTGDVSASSSSSSTGAPPECDPGVGQPNIDCMELDPERPYCAEAGVCGGCTVLPAGMGCAELDAKKPLCNPDDGKCVECTLDNQELCGGAEPACNPSTNACEGCFEHSHCPDSGACDIAARKCFPTDKVLHIRLGLPGQAPCTDKVAQGNSGTESNPYCFFDAALAHAQKDGPSSGWIFKFMQTDWQQFYQPNLAISGFDSPVTYALIHEPGSPENGDRHTRFLDGGTIVAVGTDVTVYINNFGIEAVNPASDSAHGLLCLPGARVFLDDSYVNGARGPGIRSIGCEVHLRRSAVTQGWTEGIDIVDSELHMVNSSITNNTFHVGFNGGGVAAGNAKIDILYSTIIGNNNELMAGGDSINCRDDLVTGAIRNSVIGRKSMGNNPSIKCNPANLTVTTSVLDSDEFKTGNYKTDGETILSWFGVNLTNGAAVVNKAGAPLLQDKAVWQKGDPWADYEGDPRPGKVGQYDYAGADVYVP